MVDKRQLLGMTLEELKGVASEVESLSRICG